MSTSQPEPPKRKSWPARHKILTTLGVIVAVFIIAGIANSVGGGGDTATVAQSDSGTGKKADKPKAKTASIGDPVRDGKFEFTVTKIRKGVDSIGDQYLGTKAQGQFVLVSVTVKNIGDEPQSFFGDNQYLFDAGGRKYSADSEAAVYLDDSKSLYEEINPGNEVKGTVIFDVPKDAKLKTLELHDSAFSGGIKVSID